MFRLFRDRPAFTAHALFVLAILAGTFLATLAGIPQTVYMQDASHMTSVIALLFVGTVTWLGWQAWFADGILPKWHPRFYEQPRVDASFGHLAERLLPMLGLFGTAFGLSLQAKSLVGGSAAFGPLATSLYCTAAGVLAAALVAIVTYLLEQAIARRES